MVSELRFSDLAGIWHRYLRGLQVSASCVFFCGQVCKLT